ncbi:hypothetical protein MSC49_12880 [Methylosinus sp. C49]|uniref:DUF2946 family protein n=1 Tax=Methylosinus sp. C49 TaxID=2699395 RepID=UPI0013672449|nr:hypothetical protein [Methylosinus sp. C49]BBU61353.1 hypothetical protein MSC49_12880 [Methylosinus sp. C49]
MKITGRTHLSVERATLGMVAALLFLLQTVGVGFASGATANSAQFSGVVCASFKADTAKSDTAPSENHHIGPCCILHCSSAIDVERELVLVVILPLEISSDTPAPVYVIDAVAAAPELRPLFPRAPPAPLA